MSKELKLAPPTSADKRVYDKKVREYLKKSFLWIQKPIQNDALNQNSDNYESSVKKVAETLKDNLEKSEYARNADYKDVIAPIIENLDNNDISIIFRKKD